MEYILIIDAGTTSVRAVLYNNRLQPIAANHKEFTQIFPKSGWVEHNPDEIFQAVIEVIKKTAVEKNILGIGITNQRETAVLWERSGKPASPAVVWQCRRSSAICEKLKQKGLEPLIRKKTGLVLDAYFSASKIRWLFNHNKNLEKNARRGNLFFGTIDSWLLFKLTGEYATDYTNASRTMLFNIITKKWDKQLLDIFGLPEDILPAVKPSAGNFGKISGIRGIKNGTPVVCLIGDQQASLAGNLCFTPGEMKNTYGTGCFMLMNTGNTPVFSKSGLITTIAADIDGNPCYALEGSVFMGGAVIQWMRDRIGLLENAAASEQAAFSADKNSGVIMVPAFTGLGCPYWDQNAQAAILGLRRESSAPDIIRAGLDSIALQVSDVFTEFQTASRKKILCLKVDGGACRNTYLLQKQADLLEIPLMRACDIETTALGAAVLTGLYLGIINKKNLRNLIIPAAVFKPRKNSENKILKKRWQKAVAAVRNFTA
ncbi:MAG: hypothetical protein A2096_12120 [Spirochaetes bacterium GWF1_41_5]|nr:MAG: hypothetical protein A2096_12120 [Spirochaetes bacterium GWF1_41_5]HBE01261.1 glycerol kinase [Spirochaetia bacterium]